MINMANPMHPIKEVPNTALMKVKEEERKKERKKELY